MTNNDELAMKLKAAAEMATPGEWERGDGKHGGELLVYCDDALGSAVCEATSTYNSIPKLQRIINLTFIATANPANILALLAERDWQEKRIEMLEKYVNERDAQNQDLLLNIGSLQQRIAELVNAIGSINHAKHHEMMMPGDDEPVYWQRKEWVEWILELAAGIKLEVEE